MKMLGLRLRKAKPHSRAPNMVRTKRGLGETRTMRSSKKKKVAKGSVKPPMAYSMVLPLKKKAETKADETQPESENRRTIEKRIKPAKI